MSRYRFANEEDRDRGMKGGRELGERWELVRKETDKGDKGGT